MIPRLARFEGINQTYLAFLQALDLEGFTGELSSDFGTRLIASTDNSLYQILPQAVVYPRTEEDLLLIARLLGRSEFQQITASVRGGGTGTNGQSLSEGVIVDVSKFMDQILEIDVDAAIVRVQPGVVLDQLNGALREFGYFFAPSLSPSNRATLGGMISTDAAGKGSRIYGKTSEHIVALRTILVGGDILASRALSEDGLQEALETEGKVGEIYREVNRVVTDNADLIDEVFPDLRRFMTGYNVKGVTREGLFDLNYLMAGSEGTLGILSEATLRIMPIPGHRRLCAIRYASFEDALHSAADLVSLDPGAIESIDEQILSLARKDALWHRVGPLLEGEGAEETRAINLVEFEGNDEDEVIRNMAALVQRIEEFEGQGKAIGYFEAPNPAAVEALWALRKRGVGLLGNLEGSRKPVPFIEDTVVPPAHLAEYVKELRSLLDAEGLTYGMFGHVDVGCLHVRPALDMTSKEDRERVRRITDATVELVESYGGLLWGEHGKGFRSEYCPRFFGAELHEEFCRIKATFDPNDQLNPGKLAVSGLTETRLVSIDAPTRGAKDAEIPEKVRAAFPSAMDCNGNGVCFDYDPDHIMCPSSKVTRDRVHSPKGRAGVMREWLRQLAEVGVDPTKLEEKRPSLVVRVWRRLSAHLRALYSSRRYDYSHEVYMAMDGCLSCKACSTQCPIHVDVPSLKSRFLRLYHQRYRRPIADVLIGKMERTGAWMHRMPRLANLVLFNRVSAWLLRAIVGLVDTPRYAVPSLEARCRDQGVELCDQTRLSALTPEEKSRSVLIVQDAFTSFFEPEIVMAGLQVLRALGYEPYLIPYMENGKGLHVKGYLDEFETVARRTAGALERWGAHGIPMVCFEPAVALTYREEYPESGVEVKVERGIYLLEEWLSLELDSGGWSGKMAAHDEGGYRLFAHCTEKTSYANTHDAWVAVFAALGLRLEPMEVGCCGMCGAYGHERRHQKESLGIFDMGWRRKLEVGGVSPGRVLATGHSCRGQVKRYSGIQAAHPLVALLNELSGGGRAGEASPDRNEAE